MTTIEIRRTLGPPFIQGDLKKMASELSKDDTGMHMLGTVLGKAGGLSYRHNPQDDTRPSIALTGIFEFIPVSENEPVVKATSLYLPSAVQDTIVAAMRGDTPDPIGKSPGRKDKAIELALGIVFPIKAEIGFRKQNTGGVGYEYVVNMMMEMAGNDMLADLRGDNPKLAAPTRSAIAAPAPAGKSRKSRR